MKKALLILTAFLIILSNTLISAQSNYRNEGAYFSGVVGSFHSGNTGYQKGTTSFSFGTGFGIPIVKNIYFYNKITFQSKSNFTAFENNYLRGQLTSLNELERVNASFSQFIYNGGLQYNIHFSEEITVGLNGGITYSIVNQEVHSLAGSQIRNISNEGVFGYFGGVSVEKRFIDKDLALLAEAQYLYFENDVVQFSTDLSGVNLSFGFRYYFTN